MKGLMIINNKVEDGEALFTKALLKRAGYIVDSATLENTTNIVTAYDQRISVDYLIKDINASDYDFLIIPGGGHVFNWQDNLAELLPIINAFNNQNKLIAAICAGPLFLKDTKILDNKKFTIFPGLEENIKNGIYQKMAKVVTDENIITARSAGVIYDFVFAIINYYNDKEKIEKLKKSIVY